MSASRVATAATMNVEGIKFGVKQANDSLKKLVGVAKQSDGALKQIAFLKKLEMSLKAIRLGFRAATGAFRGLLKGLSDPTAQIPFLDSFANFVNNTTKATLDQFNLGKAIDANVNEMQALALAAQDVGLETNQLYEPISKLPRKIQEAAAGFGDSVAVFSQLPDIDINALRDLGATKGGVAQLKVVADSLKKVTDQNQKLYLLTKIFEETGPKFRQLFDLGSKGLEKFEERVEKLGLTLTNVDISKFKILNIQMEELSASWSALGRDVLLKISPNLIAFLEIVKETITDPAFREKFVSTISGVLSDIGRAFLEFGHAFLDFSSQVAYLIDTITQTTKALLPNLKSGISDSEAARRFNMYESTLNRPSWMGNKLQPWQQKQYEEARDQLAGEGKFANESKAFSAINRMIGTSRASLEAVTARIDKRAAEIAAAAKKGAATYTPPVDAVDKFIEKINYRAVSNAASGSAPGKLSGSDINTAAGLETFLKSFEPGYGEDKQVTLLKEIKKEIVKGNNQVDKVAELAGAT
jgi:hypothetical protein